MELNKLIGILTFAKGSLDSILLCQTLNNPLFLKAQKRIDYSVAITEQYINNVFVNNSSAVQDAINHKIKYNLAVAKIAERMINSAIEIDDELVIVLKEIETIKIKIKRKENLESDIFELKDKVELSSGLQKNIVTLSNKIDSAIAIISNRVLIHVVSHGFNKELARYERLSIVNPAAPRVAKYETIEDGNGEEYEVFDCEKSGKFRKMPFDLQRLISTVSGHHESAIKRIRRNGWVVVIDDVDIRGMPEYQNYLEKERERKRE